MTRVVLIIDGMMDLDNIIPLETKDLFNITYTTFSKETPDSLKCFMRLVKEDERIIKDSCRASYELIGHNPSIKYLDKYVCRCNLVKVENDVLVDFTSGLSETKANEILNQLKTDFIDLYPTSGYRAAYFVDDINTINLKPPHLCVNEKITEMNDVMIRSKEYFKQKGLKYMLYLFNPGRFETRITKTKNKVCLIASLDSIKGYGYLKGFDVISTKEMTGNIDTNLELKLSYTIDNINEYDDIYLHINGADEIAHKKDKINKLKFINEIENKIIKPLINKNKEFKFELDIVCDHVCDSTTGLHYSNLVPYMIYKGELNE